MTSKSKKQDIPNWVLWIAERGFTVVLTIVIFVMISVAAGAYWLDHRIDRLADKISRKPPSSYSPPDLDAYKAPEFAPGQVVDNHSVYVPVYSHVYFDGGRPLLLEATLSIRNPSPKSPVYVQSVAYYDTEGEQVSEMVKQTIMLKPLQTIEFVVPQRDNRGGSGANFLVEWAETDGSVEPIVEAVMIGNAGTIGTSFRAQGVEIPQPSAR